MMGTKKLSAIRSEVRDAFVRAGIDPVTWLEQEIHTTQQQPPAGPLVLETLQLLRDALAREAQKGRKKTTRRMPVR